MNELAPRDLTCPGEKICTSLALRDGGPGVRFRVMVAGRPAPAFAVRHAGRVAAYLNRCAHKHVELDWQEGEFFDIDARFLVCATHGALYDPLHGQCVAGPCRGASLTALPVREGEGGVWLLDYPGA